MNDQITYTAAFEELQQLVAEIEQGEISIDDLTLKVKRAAFLIHFCKKKLKTTEEEVDQILEELEE